MDSRFLVFFRHAHHRVVVQYGSDKRYQLAHIDTTQHAFDPGAFKLYTSRAQAERVHARYSEVPIGRVMPTNQLVLDAFELCESPVIDVLLARVIQFPDGHWVVHTYVRSNRIHLPTLGRIHAKGTDCPHF